MTRADARPWVIAGLALLALRAALPLAVKAAINDGFGALEGYGGRVEDVDFILWRGRFRVEGLRLWKEGKPRPLFARVESVEASVLWKPLFKGRLIFSVAVRNPVASMREEALADAAPGPASGGAPVPPKVPWTRTVRGFLPFKLERMTVSDGSFRFETSGKGRPPVSVLVEDVHVKVENLTNSRTLSTTMFADVRAAARVMGSGALRVNMKVNPLSEPPAFDMDFELKSLDLKAFNAFFRSYGNLDVHGGTFSMAGEAAARNGKISGYVRPALEDVKVFSWKKDVEEQREGAARALWEGAVEAVKNIFERSKPKEQVATRIPLEGTITDPRTDLLTIALNVLRNAFVRAILPVLEHSVRL